MDGMRFGKGAVATVVLAAAALVGAGCGSSGDGDGCSLSSTDCVLVHKVKGCLEQAGWKPTTVEYSDPEKVKDAPGLEAQIQAISPGSEQSVSPSSDHVYYFDTAANAKQDFYVKGGKGQPDYALGRIVLPKAAKKQPDLVSCLQAASA